MTTICLHIEHRRWPGFASLILLASLLAGCGLPGQPSPPTLDLPRQVTDLGAERVGASVELHWTNPVETTDKLKIRGEMTARVCRRVGAAPCIPLGAKATARPDERPGALTTFQDELTGQLLALPAERLEYRVELLNVHEKSAGESNSAFTMSGPGPGEITDLKAESTARGVLLSWKRGDSTGPPPGQQYRIRRTLLTPPKSSAEKPPLATAQPSPPGPAKAIERSFLVEADSNALDASSEKNARYRFTVQPILIGRSPDSSAQFEVAAHVAGPVEVDTKDVFPPNPPVGLAAIATDQDSASSIDLSWTANTEDDLAGYVVFRLDETAHGNWGRITPSLIASPNFRDLSVQPAHRYQYAVAAEDLSGNLSQRSQATAETALPSSH